MNDECFEEYLRQLTEGDAGFRNDKDYHERHGLPTLTLDDYREKLRFNRRDEQQMIDMGR